MSGAPRCKPGCGTCARCAEQEGRLQRKLAIGSTTDPLEREADRVAERIVTGWARGDLSRVPVKVQRGALPAAPESCPAPASVEDALATSGRPLDGATRADMEQRFGHDFSNVRVHDDSKAARSARGVQALAYTVGRDIFFGAGQFAPSTPRGRRLLAHELTHVVQQGNAQADLVRRAPAAPLERVEELLSYGLFDWAITDSEAMEAMALLQAIPPDQLPAELKRLDSKYVTRLLDNLPDAAKTGDDYRRIVEALGPAGVLPHAEDQLSYGLFDWAVTGAEVTRVFNTWTTLPADAREPFLVSLNATGRFGRLVSNANAGHHALYLRPWIATLPKAAVTPAQRALLRTVVEESDNVETLKLCAVTRFGVSVDKPANKRKTWIEWDADRLQKTYLAMDDLPTAHVTGSPQLTNLAEFEQAGKEQDGKTYTTAGVYMGDKRTLAVNKVASEDFTGTIVHEIAHSVDQCLRWSSGKKFQEARFGGWKVYEGDDATCASEMVADSKGGIDKLEAQRRTDVVGQIADAMATRKADGLVGNIRKLAWFGGLKRGERNAITSDDALDAVSVGMMEAKPWFTQSEGGVRLNGRIYEEGYQNEWARYNHEARDRKVSPYQFRYPGEWFAEAYRVYYTPDSDGKGAKLAKVDRPTKVYFDTDVDPAKCGAAPAAGSP